MSDLNITISPAPGTRNLYHGQHWAKYQKEKSAVAWQVFCQVQQAGRPSFERVRVHLKRTGWNRVDPTGLWESVKPVLDALVNCGVIPDDSGKHVSLGETEQNIQRKRKGWSELVVRLEEM